MRAAVALLLACVVAFGLYEFQHQHVWASQGFNTDPVACPGGAPIVISGAHVARSDFEQVNGTTYLKSRSDCYRLTFTWTDGGFYFKTHHAQIGVYKRVSP